MVNERDKLHMHRCIPCHEDTMYLNNKVVSHQVPQMYNYNPRSQVKVMLTR